MKSKIAVTFLFLFTISSIQAQNWLTDIKKAESIATKENKNIILVFEGSDWCAPCKKLNKEIWSTEEFKTYANDHYVMLLADFPKRKKNKLDSEQQHKNNVLAEKYNKHGYFPHVVVLNEKGDVLGRTGYKKVSPKEYIKILNSF